MNGRQAAKLANMRVMDLERIRALNIEDIVDYNLCILSMIDGGSPCPFCEDYEECQLEAKDHKGCGQWMVRSHEKRIASAAKAAEEAGDPDGEQGSETGIDSVQRVEEQ